MVALSKSFITATPSYCSWRRSCAREGTRDSPRLQPMHLNRRGSVQSLCQKRSTWYSICNVSRCTPMNLAFTSKTPTASDGEISKIAFLNLQREEKDEVRGAAAAQERCASTRS